MVDFAKRIVAVRGYAVWSILRNGVSRCGRFCETDCRGVVDFAKRSFAVWSILRNGMGLAVGYFASKRYDEAVSEARRSVRANPGFSVRHLVLAASLAALDLISEAKLAAARVSVLVPNFTVEGNLLRPTGVPAALAAPFSEACRAAGLP
jgi:hypothetical protein